MTLKMRYVVASRTTGHIHWHGNAALLSEQMHDAVDAERARRHVEELAATHPASGPYELRAVTPQEFRRLVLEAGALLLLRGQSADTLECRLFDPS